MGLEKSFFDFKKNLTKAIIPLSLVALLSSCPNPKSESPQPKNPFEYKTSVTIFNSKEIDSETGGEIRIDDENSLLYGTTLTIPVGSLNKDTTISLGVVDNPPPLPSGMNYVGTTVDLEPDGINFNMPSAIQLSYSDESLSDAGLSDDSNLKLYSYNRSLNNWEEVNKISIHTDLNIITAEINHFSYYAITGSNCPIPEDLGNLEPGDLLYSLGAFWDPGNSLFKDNWMPGHVGIYVGEKKDDKGNNYNVIEADGNKGFVVRSYFNPITNFSGLNTYAGSREPKEPKDFVLSPNERTKIVDFAEAQVGKPYAFIQTFGAFKGMAMGSLVKGGLGSFNCVGLAEAAYEFAGINDGEGLVSWLNEDFGSRGTPAMLTPAEQYNATKPAIGTPRQIGERGIGGGWIFYDKGNYSGGWRYLEAAPEDQQVRAWGTSSFNIQGADGTAIGTGKQNTLDIINGDPLFNSAAKECSNYSRVHLGITYDDWFLPSKDELIQMVFILTGQSIGYLSEYCFYWSSSESTPVSAWGGIVTFGGDYKDASKEDICYVRAIRAF